jgi:long-subunit acyl-CoA synthetase (AMP-forming)
LLRRVNIIPGFIELLLRNSFVRQAVLLGDRRPFIAALIVPERKENCRGASRRNQRSTVRWQLCYSPASINQFAFGAVREDSQVRSHENDFWTGEDRTVFQKIKIDLKAVEEYHQKKINAIYLPVVERQGV